MLLKKQRIIVASDQVDRHGDQLALSALEDLKNIINGEYAVRLGVEHNRTFPPKGRQSNAEIIEKDGIHLLLADNEPYTNITPVDWDSRLIMESFTDGKPFVEVKNEPLEELAVFVDPHNFQPEDYLNFETILKKQEINYNLHHHFRKSLISDPEIIFSIPVTIFLYQFVKPFLNEFGKETGKEAGKGVASEGKKLYSFIKTTVKEAAQRCNPKKRPLFVVFEIQDKPHIELVIKTRDAEEVVKALSTRKLNPVITKTEEISKRVEIAKIQYVFTAKGKWEFNYLLTTDGSTIGTKESFKKRDRKLLLISEKSKSPNKNPNLLVQKKN